MFQEIDINAILQKLGALLSETFPKTIETALELHPDIPPLMADPNQIYQILLNLCVDARDAMPNGGELLLETSTVNGAELRQSFRGAEGERYVCIRVTDTGTGIDEVTRKRIFEPFFTTKSAATGDRSRSFGGLWNRGEPCGVRRRGIKGPFFVFTYQFRGKKLSSSKYSQNPTARRRNASLDAARQFLFVDDEEKQLRLMREFLESEGYTVLTARDGAEAVEMHALHKEEIAVVVLDLGLPKVNGWEAFQRMRKIHPTLNTLFATGFSSPEIEAEMKRGRLSGIINKPYQLDEVLEKISAAIRDQQN